MAGFEVQFQAGGKPYDFAAEAFHRLCSTVISDRGFGFIRPDY